MESSKEEQLNALWLLTGTNEEEHCTPALDWPIKFKAANSFCFKWVTYRTVG